MTTQYYTDLRPVFPDPETWTFAHVLRHWAKERPDAHFQFGERKWFSQVIVSARFEILDFIGRRIAGG